MSMDYKTKMAEAVAADKEQYGDEFAGKMTLYTDNVFAVDDAFVDDPEYYDGMSNLHETSLFTVNFNDEEMANPKILAEYLKDSFETVVNSTGLDVKAKLDMEDDHVEANFFTEDGQHVGSGSLFSENIEPEMYQSHRVFLDALQAGIQELNAEDEFAKAVGDIPMAADPGMNK